MKEVLKILFVEDVLNDAELIWREIEKSELIFTKLLVNNREDYIHAIDEFIPDIIISDYLLPQFDGMKALLIRNEKSPLSPFILVTGSINEEIAVECMKAGADDYILKDNLSRLGPAILNSINRIKILREKKSAEDKLYQSEQRLQKAQSIAHVGNWEIDFSRKSVQGSEEALRIYGFDTKTHEVSLDIIQKIPLPEYRGILDEAMDRLLKYNEPYEAEFKIKRANDGCIRSIYSKAELVLSDNSEQVKIIGVIQDITERKKSEDALKESELRFKQISDNSGNWIWEVDRNGLYTYSSQVVKGILGFEPEEIINKKHFFDFFKSDEMAGLKAAALDVFNRKESFRDFININLHKDGREVILSTSGIPVLDSMGNLLGYRGVDSDITERIENERELIKAKEKAEESNKLKTAFLHNVSHEIRTPMNSIVGFSSLLGESDIDAQTRRLYIETIMQSSNHLLSIISDIVDISIIEANLVKINKSEININSTLKSICNQFIHKADEKKIMLVCETGLSDADALILTDSTKLIQILSNLINNSLKFTEKGSLKLKYAVNENFLEFSVSDTGIGIPPEFHEKIFDRFYQVQNTATRVYEGTGLGLAISKAYVDLMGGRIWLSSESGNGTTFYFTIPYEKPVFTSHNMAEKRVQEDVIFQTGKTILVAEDDESNFKLIQYFLSGANVNVIRATNGKEAVEKALTDKNIDIILMDIKMPIMDGYTAVNLIREKNSLIPIIAQTAYADDKQRVIECGCSGFISKPFNKNSLLKILTEFI